MIIVLLIIHGILAVILLGAITHQAFSVARTSSGPARSFLDKFGRVNPASYAQPVVWLFAITAIGGGLLYPQYRIDVRPALEDLNFRGANGIFEIKEHLVALGLGMLPSYWLHWRTPLVAAHAATRRYMTWMLAALVWWSFVVGHVLNNIKGLLP